MVVANMFLEISAEDASLDIFLSIMSVVTRIVCKEFLIIIRLKVRRPKKVRNRELTN